jgi:hypothetical protein
MQAHIFKAALALAAITLIGISTSMAALGM